MKRISVFLVLMVCLLPIISACETKNEEIENGSNKGKVEASQDLLSKIQKNGKILIGTEGTYPPFSFHGKDGELTGFDVEIAKEVVKRLGVEAEFKETQWDAIFAGLDSKRFDMIVNQVWIREDRVDKYDFSDPYITTTAVLITRLDNEKVKSFADIKGLKSAQTLTSSYAEIVRSYGSEVIGVEGFNQAIELLTSKRVDITVNSKLSYLDYKKNKPDALVKVVDTSKDVTQMGITFRKGNESLVIEVNKALKEMIEDGTYLKISKKWFDENVLK